MNKNDVKILYDAFVDLCDYIEIDTDKGCVNCPLSKEICFNKDGRKGSEFADVLKRIREEVNI